MSICYFFILSLLDLQFKSEYNLRQIDKIKVISFKSDSYIYSDIYILNTKMQNRQKIHILHTLAEDQKQQSENEQKIPFSLPEANPIKKREKLQPYSIFPLYSLPKFKFNSDTVEPTIFNDSVPLSSQRLVLQSNLLVDLFRQPVYIYNSRASMKNNNDFACLRVQFSESLNYKMMQNVQTIQQYLQVNKKASKLSQDVLEQESPSLKDKQIQNQWASTEIIDKKNEQKQQIYFQSRFQSGNLCFASINNQSSEPTYNLVCSRDMNTSKCTQWFFFKTINKIPGKVTFHILNFIKGYSIFQYGMKICYASKSNGYTWCRGCTDIKYRQTNICMGNKKNNKYYYALTFSYTYSCPEDNLYFAYCFPYTYSMLEQFLFHRTQTSPYMKRRNIAVTPGGNSVDLITISNFKQKQKKRTVFITSRVHPGETPSSFVCEGMMKYLLGNSEEALVLRDNFIFKFVPMLNPDGVINGAYRCSLSGYDLNRVWHKADKVSHPEIYGTRKAVFETNQADKIFLFMDLHAHSKKKGVFAYGCQNKGNPYLCRQIPFLFWKNIPDFVYFQCNFMMKTGREGTSRLYIYRQLDINYSYTIEHSFCGPSKDKVHYNPKDYLRIGVGYLQTFHKFLCRYKKSMIQTSEFEIFQQLYTNKQLIKIGDTQQFSSSDEELDKEKALELIDQKIQKKVVSKKETLRLSQGAFSNPKRANSFRKTNMLLNQELRFKQMSMNQKQIQNFGETMRPLPVVNTSTKFRLQIRPQQEVSNYLPVRPRICSSSLTNHLKPDNEKKHMRQTFRYEEDEQINSLTNLFLPSLTKASYRKYSRKSSSPKNLVHVGTNLIQNAIILKEQIKSVQRRKPNWKQHVRSYL